MVNISHMYDWREYLLRMIDLYRALLITLSEAEKSFCDLRCQLDLASHRNILAHEIGL